MDSFSGEMTIRFSLMNNKIDPLLIKKKNYKLLSDIEGTLEIVLNHNVFFQEDSVLLMEFALELIKWRRSLDKEIYNNFEYFSMSHNEEPLLTFSHNVGNNNWCLSSPWKEFDFFEGIDTNEIKVASDVFLKSFTTELKKQYDIKLYEFV